MGAGDTFLRIQNLLNVLTQFWKFLKFFEDRQKGLPYNGHYQWPNKKISGIYRGGVGGGCARIGQFSTKKNKGKAKNTRNGLKTI